MVYLVGAGPGDQGLITLKGKKCIENADVIAFDKLANGSLLSMAREECELIYVGKQSGNHHLKQDEINALLVKKAREGKTVVRLKGGDPFIFGRGGEEAEELKKFGIPFEIVPGVSSCYSAAAYAGIPVTHRSCASAFHVITGHESDDKNSSLTDYKTIARLDGTIVFLMSLKNLPSIVKQLIENGKSGQTPCAVIQSGTTSKQKCVTGTLSTICDEAEKGHIKTPALTVVGDTVKLKERFEWFGGGDLFGKTIMLTGTREFNQRIESTLSRYGAQLLNISLVGVRYINDEALDAVNLSEYTHIALTSRTGVNALFKSLERTKKDVRTLGSIQFAAVGSATADALKQHGIYADLTAENGGGAQLGRLIAESAKKDIRVLLVRSSRAVRTIDNVLTRSNIAFDELAAYETYTDYSRGEVINAYSDLADYAVIASPSAADAYKEICKSNNIKLIAIGDTTASYMREIGFEGFLISAAPNAEGICEIILTDIKRGR